MLSNGKVLTIITELVWRGTSEIFYSEDRIWVGRCKEVFS